MKDRHEIRADLDSSWSDFVGSRMEAEPSSAGFGAFGRPDGVPSGRGAAPPVPTELLVQFRPGIAVAAQRASLDNVGGLAGNVLRSSSEDGDLLLVSLNGKSASAVIATLANNPNIRFAEVNATVAVQVVSNDPSVTGGSTWGLYGDASPLRTNVFGSQAAEAWNIDRVGSTKTVIGVIDSGIDYTHPDLYLNVWLNPGEVPTNLGLVDTDGDGLITFRDLNNSANAGAVSDLNANGRIDAGDLLRDPRWENGVDNDGNRYVDDLVGWDFVNNDNDPFDDNNHGTHVAGTIAGIGGNGVGVAGVNWTGQVMGLKFLSGTGSGSTANAVLAVDYYTNAARAHDAGPGNYVATNNSWGGGGFSQALLDSIVRGAKADVLFVAAAGNGGSDGVGDNNDSIANYPSNYSTLASAGWEAVVAVASITSTGARSSFSNFGLNTVDIGAPGSGILSTLPNGTYGSFSGTSMATPHVAGALGLVSAAFEGLTGAQLRSALMSSAEATASLANITVSGGRLDITDMLTAAQTLAGTAPPPPANLALYGTTGNDTLIGGAGNDILSGVPATGTNLGRGSIDRLTGGAGNDLFILGDARGRFYDDGNSRNAGNSDHAIITDFGTGDRLQLANGNYIFRNATVNGVSGVGVYHDSNNNGSFDNRDELIAIVQGVSSLSLANVIFA